MTRVALALDMSEAVLGKWVRIARNQAARPRGSDALEEKNKQLRALCALASTRPPRTTQADPQAVTAANKLATWPVATAPNQI